MFHCSKKSNELSPAKTASKYLVTGANGYVAMHVIDQLLKQGQQVRGTVRSLNDKQKVDELRKLGPIELVEADLLDPQSWRNAVQNIDIVLHVASPITLNPNADENSVVKPAVDGTLNVLKAALDSKVRRVVVTSSALTIYNFLEATDKNYTFSEKDRVPAEKAGMAYQKSKILAEKVAWDFYEQHKRSGKCFELITIHPGFVMGPPLTVSGCTSVAMFSSLFGQEKTNSFATPACDVRDVALAHIRAAQIPEAAGQRILVLSSTNQLTNTFITDTLRKAGYKAAQVDDTSDPLGNNKPKFDNSKMRNILKIQPIEIKKSILDMAESLVRFGVIKN